ncbi:hypothetical protein ExPUPEC119_03464 [Escherichia coli]|nr:hypothetical protein ExPUPEC119_03464 [Escherichia coli]
MNTRWGTATSGNNSAIKLDCLSQEIMSNNAVMTDFILILLSLWEEVFKARCFPLF